jgi:hypothetical protein
MYRKIAKILAERGFSCLVYQDTLYAERGLLIAIISKLGHKEYRVEINDTGQRKTYVAKVETTNGVIKCIEEYCAFLVL